MVKPDWYIGMTEQEIRKRVVEEAAKLVGIKEGSAAHKKLIDTYNTRLPKLPRGYKLTYSAPWCAATMTYIGIVLQISHIILPECSCSKMIELYRQQGRWMEADDYVPQPADICMLDWDATKGECEGNPEHVGMVEWCDGKNVGLIDGNNGDNMVGRRTVPVEYIKTRGFCLPDYGKLVQMYTDVPAGAWYRGDVLRATELGLMEGVGDGRFEPDRAPTRAELAAVAVRLYDKFK